MILTKTKDQRPFADSEEVLYVSFDSLPDSHIVICGIGVGAISGPRFN